MRSPNIPSWTLAPTAGIVLNGTALTGGQWYDLTPAQLAQLTYVGARRQGPTPYR